MEGLKNNEAARLLQEKKAALKEKIGKITDDAALEIINELLAENEILESDNKIAEEIIKDQSEQIKKLESAPVQTPVVSVEKADLPTVVVDTNEWQFTKPFFKVLGDAKRYAAVDVVKNEEFIKKIIAIEGQTILKKK